MDDSNTDFSGTHVSHRPECIRIEVLVVDWEGTHTTIPKFVTVKELPVSATAEEIDQELRAIKADPKYFGTCSKCKKHMPEGHMFCDDFCHGCASSEFNIVY